MVHYVAGSRFKTYQNLKDSFSLGVSRGPGCPTATCPTRTPPVYIACSTWHVITEEIFVYFVRVPQNCSRLAAKGSQLSKLLLLLLLLQPESLIKTRCFHLGQLCKESLPEIWCALPNLLPRGAWDAAVGAPRIKTLQGSGFSFGSLHLQIHTRPLPACDIQYLDKSLALLHWNPSIFLRWGDI